MKLLIAALLLASPVWAVSLEEARREAPANHPSVGAARSAVDAARARLRMAKAGRMPQLGFSGLSKAGLSGAMNGLDPIGLANSPFFRNFAAGANIAHPGFDFGRTRSNIAVEQHRMSAAEADLAAAEAEVLLRVETAYFTALDARAAQRAATSLVAGREAAARQAQAFYEAELRSKVDFGAAEAQLAAARARLAAAAEESAAAHARLAYAMGAAPEDLGAPDEPETEERYAETLDALIARAYGQRPDLHALQARRDAAQAVLSLAQAQRKPWFRVLFTGGWARFNPLQLSNLTALGVGLSMPLLTFGATEGAVEEAEALLDRAERRLEEAQQLAALETRLAFYAFRAAREKLPLRERQAELSSEAARLARARYREQLASLVELAQAESNLAAAQAAALAARYAVRKTLAELRHAVGEMHAAASAAP